MMFSQPPSNNELNFSFHLNERKRRHHRFTNQETTIRQALSSPLSTSSSVQTSPEHHHQNSRGQYYDFKANHSDSPFVVQQQRKFDVTERSSLLTTVIIAHKLDDKKIEPSQLSRRRRRRLLALDNNHNQLILSTFTFGYKLLKALFLSEESNRNKNYNTVTKKALPGSHYELTGHNLHNNFNMLNFSCHNVSQSRSMYSEQSSRHLSLSPSSNPSSPYTTTDLFTTSSSPKKYFKSIQRYTIGVCIITFCTIYISCLFFEKESMSHLNDVSTRITTSINDYGYNENNNANNHDERILTRLRDEFHEWIEHHSRDYENDEEKDFRFNVWKENHFR